MNRPLPLLVLALAFVLGGCISISAPSVPRPAEWGAVQKTEGECPLVAGSYREEGEGPGPASLSYLTLVYPQGVDAVTIVGPSEGKITVEALREGRVIEHKEFPRNAYFYSYFMDPPFYKCDGDTVELRTHYEVHRGSGAGSSKTENVVLQKATDGHLIVMHEKVATDYASVPALFLFWYSYKKSQTWFRFEPIAPSGLPSVQPANSNQDGEGKPLVSETN